MSKASIPTSISRFLLLIAALALSACATSQGSFSLYGSSYAAKPLDSPIDILDTIPPIESYSRIARLDAHFEKTGWASTSKETGLAEIKKQARLAGADAVIKLEESRSRVNETLIYHISAVAIKYKQR